MPVGSSTTANDAGKFIQDALIARSELLHRIPQFLESVSLPEGNGKTANFIKYNRTEVPVAPLTEGETPDETPFTVSTQSVVTDQWGMYIGLTDVITVTTKHPVLNEALDLVADAMARVMDHTIFDVIMAGTNKQYFDGSRANRGAITAADVFDASVFNKARADMNDLAVPGRDGDIFIAVMGPAVEADFLAETATVGGFVAAQQASGKLDKLEKGVVGTWLGFKVVRTNFIPKFTKIATFTSIVAGAGGALSGTVYYKVTRKNLQRGFEEDIQAEGNTAMGGNNRLAFTAPATAAYVYNIYAGTVTGDSNLYRAKENLAASGVYNLDAVPTSGTNPPATPPTGVTVHPVILIGAKAMDYVKQDGMGMESMITPKGPSDSDPLSQRRKVGSKWMGKSGIRDNDRVKVVELASSF